MRSDDNYYSINFFLQKLLFLSKSRKLQKHFKHLLPTRFSKTIFQLKVKLSKLCETYSSGNFPILCFVFVKSTKYKTLTPILNTSI